MFWILILGLLGFSLTAAYRGINLLNWTIGMALILFGFAIFTSVSMLAIVVLSVLFAAIAVPLNFKPLRRQWLSAPFLAVYRKMLPTLSDTEKVALEAGTVGWEGELFAGNPNWDSLLEEYWPQLSIEEQAFVDGPVEELCNMLNPWENSHELADLPPEVWSFLKDNRFFRNDYSERIWWIGLLRTGAPRRSTESRFGLFGSRQHCGRPQLTGSG